jgi:hypothetical protein
LERRVIAGIPPAANDNSNVWEAHDRPDVVRNFRGVFTHQRLAHLGSSLRGEKYRPGQYGQKRFHSVLKHGKNIPDGLGYNAVNVCVYSK